MYSSTLYYYIAANITAHKVKSLFTKQISKQYLTQYHQTPAAPLVPKACSALRRRACPLNHSSRILSGTWLGGFPAAAAAAAAHAASAGEGPPAGAGGGAPAGGGT